MNIKQLQEKANIIIEERQRILSLVEKLIEKEKMIYGTDKHGISLNQIKQILKNK